MKTKQFCAELTAKGCFVVSHIRMDFDMEAKVTIEKSTDGTYSAYMDEIFPEFGLAGYGDTAEEAVNDFLLSYDETKEYLHQIGKEMPRIAFVFPKDCNLNTVDDCSIRPSLASI